VSSPRVVEVRRGVLQENDVQAARLRARFAAADTRVVNLVSSPGTGKTALLEELLRRMSLTSSVAALVGDCATDNDAIRLARSGAPVRHLVEQHLDHFDLDATDVLFIENVGNLVCPASFDLGESLRIALLSVTEGEDKPLKYPAMFSSSDLVVITKIDLAAAVGFDRPAALGAIESVHPGIPVFETSARTGAGLDQLISSLLPVPART
jgi:hydrogenase nickel incorporation protein HypB